MVTDKKPTLAQMRELMRRMGYAYGTENTYCDWVTRFIKFHRLQNRQALLDSVEQKVAPNTQNQAFNALVFLYNKVLQQPRIPVTFTKEEVRQVLILIDGTVGIIVKLLYAGGLRISEAVRLRVQDIDFGFKQITIRDGKGKKGRATLLANNFFISGD